jgi:hypothetical protein
MEDDREKRKKSIKKWKKTNPDKVKEQKRRWRERHKEDIKKTFDKWKRGSDYNEKMRKYGKEKYKNDADFRERLKVRATALKEFKQGIIDERGYRCEICHASPKNIDLHHIEYDNKIENLILLCRGCHMKVHKGIINIMKGGEI